MKKFLNILKSIFYYGWISIIYFVLFCTIWFVSYVFIQPNVYDYMIKNFSAKNYGNDDTVIVTIDDKSVNNIRWPWSRDLHAKIINYFSEYTDIKALIIDTIIMGNDDNVSKTDAQYFDALKNINDRLVVGFMPSVMPYQSDFDYEKYENSFREKYKLNIKEDRINSLSANYISMNIMPESYSSAIKYTGSVKVMNNPITGSVTASLPIVNINGYLYPSLALKTYMLTKGADNLTLYDTALKVDKTGLIIPLEYNTPYIKNFIRYYKLYPHSRYSHKQYSAIDILKSYENIQNGQKPIIDPMEFSGKTIVYGNNASGEILGSEDYEKTPVSDAHPGPDIQATIYDNYVNNELITRPLLIVEFLAIFILSLVVMAIILNIGFGLAITVIFGMIAGYFATCAYYLYPKGIAPDVISPVVIILATLIFGYAFKFIAENKNKEKVKNAMGKYLSKTVMRNVVKDIDNVKLGGRKAVVTVLFADIRGFTSMSEKMSAEEVSLILNEYFSAIEPIITKYNGVINKFIGDAVMAIFGDPINDEMHQMNAVLCANEMLKRVRKLRNKWMDENKPEIEIGIGINTGEVFVGNIGSETRLEYTVIGDTVNIASRIESYNKVYKTNFLIGSSTYNSVKNRVDVIKISGVTIRGKQNKMDIYEILRVNSGEEV